jgi:membrane protein implicated in regulation of membrane protease activity
MSNVDWPLAITLLIVFVVMSVVRWRYFQRRAKRRAALAKDETPRV